jgi:hypothetical protein
MTHCLTSRHKNRNKSVTGAVPFQVFNLEKRSECEFRTNTLATSVVSLRNTLLSFAKDASVMCFG